MCHPELPHNITRFDVMKRGPQGTKSRRVVFTLPYLEHGLLQAAADRHGITMSPLLRRLAVAEIDSQKDA